MTRFWEKIFFHGQIVSEKSPESRPEIAKSGKSLEKVSGISGSHRPFFGNSFRDLPIWVNGNFRSKMLEFVASIYSF